MKMNKLRIVSLTLCIISFIGQLILYPRLPEVVATHWDFNGEVNGYSSKPTLLFLSLLPLLLLLLFQVIPKLDPRGRNYQKHEKAYDAMILSTTLLMIGVTWVTNLSALHYAVPVEGLVPVGVGILFLVLGNYMPQIRPNYTFGIKTPWALENEWVWKKTHAFGGKVFCFMGILMILSGLLPGKWLTLLTIVIVIAGTLWMYVYSYLMYKKWLRGQGGDE